MENPKLLRSHHPKHGGPPCIPEDLIINILSRLESKILCKFKSVSKYVLFLISSDSHFKDLHRIQSLKNPRLLQYDLSVFDGLDSSYLLSQSTFDIKSGHECDKFDLAISKGSRKNDSFHQVTSCRELLCINTERQILVVNPSTHQFISLDVKNKILRDSVGIGYVSACKEYKVVMINRSKIASARGQLIYHDQGFQVYTMKDGSGDYTISAKIFEGSPQDNFREVGLVEQQPICVDGILYWLSITCPVTKKMVVYYLNLEDYSYGKFHFLEGGNMAKLVELQGCLCIQCSFIQSKGFLVYALKDAKLGLWEQVYNILYPPGIDWSWIELVGVLFNEQEITDYMSSIPGLSTLTPNLLGFLPSNNSGNEVPEYVLSQHIDHETHRVYIVDNGILRTTTNIIRFCPRRIHQQLYYEGLFSFKSL